MQPSLEPDRLEELQKEKDALFEELAKVAAQQKELARQVFAAERQQRALLRGVEEYIAPEDRELTLADIERWVRSVHWQYARSMPGNPHSYCHLKWCSEAMFRRVARFIRTRGYVQFYGGAGYWTLDLADSYLWVNNGPDRTYEDPKPVEDLILINRKPDSLRPE